MYLCKAKSAVISCDHSTHADNEIKDRKASDGLDTYLVWLPLATNSFLLLKNFIEVKASVLPTACTRSHGSCQFSHSLTARNLED
jgi:hypothetical protein